MVSLDGFFENVKGEKSKNNFVFFLIVSAVFGLALWLRYLPVENLDYIQALDPYMIARMSASFAESGSLPVVDVLRYYPFFNPTYMINTGTVIIPALMFRVFTFFGFDFLSWAQFYPALMGALSIIPIYFLGKYLVDRKAGVFSAFFLATSVAVMHRSSAGWFGKEPPAIFLFITAIYFFMKAWNENEWWPGILAGVLTGISGTAWGGTRFLYMLFPVTVLLFVAVVPIVASIPVTLMDKKMKKLEVDRVFKAFTPVAILGTVLTVILDGSPNTLTLPNTYFYFNIGVLAFLTIRYFLEKYEFVSEKNTPYISHFLVFVGGMFLFLAPLFSPTIAGTTSSIISSALQTSGGVIGGTVAENAPASIEEAVGQLGASLSGEMFPVLGSFADFFSGWTFGLIGFSFVSVFILMLFISHYFDVEEFRRNFMVGGVSLVLSVVSLLVFVGLAGTDPTGFFPALVLTMFATSSVYLYNEALKNDVEQWILVIFLIWAGIFVMSVFMNELFLAAGLGAVQGIFLMFQDSEKITVSFEWSYLVVIVWMASTVYGATQRTRLFILTGAPTALIAGIGLSKSWEYVRSCKFWDDVREKVGGLPLFKILAVLFIVVMVVVNVSAVMVRSEGLVGSPEQPWYDAFDFLREETPEGSVVLSWWDYGYWTQSLGERPTIADGGNHRHYTNENVTERVNYPIADFFASGNPENYTDWLDSYGADYVMLDATMIGKYSAVSQISQRSNTDFDHMDELNCQYDEITGCAMSEVGGSTVVHYDLGPEMELLLPVNIAGNDASIDTDNAPIIRSGGMQVEVSNVCTEDGLVSFTDEGTTGGLQESISDSVMGGEPFGGCVAINPYFGAQRAVLVPPNIMDHTLVRLYLMDGYGIDFVEKVFDNSYVKIWEIER